MESQFVGRNKLISLQPFHLVMTQSKEILFYPFLLPAGFPSPAQDYMEEEIDLNTLLRPKPSAMFLVRVQGDSMIDAHITSNAILVVDKSVKPRNNMIVVAVINGEFTVKRLLKSKDGVVLKPENSKYKPIQITEDMDFKVWGVVTNIIIDAKQL